MVHAMKGRKMKGDGEEDWVKNLMAVGPSAELEDENAASRRRSDALKHGALDAPPGGELTAKDKEKSDDEKKERKKKKKAKKEARGKAKGEELLSGRHPVKAATKTLEAVFGGTALDPKEKVRRRVKAQRFASRKTGKRSRSAAASQQHQHRRAGCDREGSASTRRRGPWERGSPEAFAGKPSPR